MVRAWYFDALPGDQRKPHKGEDVSLDELEKIGVLYWKLDALNYKQEGLLERIRSERSYVNKDEITVSPDHLPNYEQKIRVFFEEHLHADEEVRFILEGSGYFDVRDSEDRWIRIEMVPGDLIVLPAGIYHRFTLDTKVCRPSIGCNICHVHALGSQGHKNYIKAMRLFKEDPVWTPVNRPVGDSSPARSTYLETLTAV